MNHIASLLFLGLLTCGMLTSCGERAEAKEVKVELGKVAPDFEFKDLATDKNAKLSDFKGKVVVAKFWWSNCVLCNAKMDHMQEFIDKHAEWKDDVVFLAVSIDKTLGAAKRHVAKVEGEEGRSWSRTQNCWHDSKGGESPTYQAYAAVTGVPVSYIIDRNGKVAAIDSPQDEDEFDLDQAVRKLLSP